MLAIALGAVVGNLLPARARAALAPGLTLFTKRVLKAAIILLGLKLTADQAQNLGGPILLLIGACLVLAVVAGAGFGRMFGVSRRVATLLGCGTAICGATAIVTVAPLVEAKEDEVAFSIATIFIFNVAALFAFPAIGRALGMTDLQFGAWVGTAVNDTAAVVATGKAWSGPAQLQATAVKLIRTLALVPMAILVAAMTARARGGGEGGSGGAAAKRLSVAAVFPWFVLGFAGTALLANLVHLPPKVTEPLLRAAGLAIVAVLASVGLNLNAAKVFGSGFRSLVLGLAIATFMAAASLGLIRVLGIT